MGKNLEKRLKPIVIKMSKKHFEKYAVVSNDNKIIAYGNDIPKIIKESEKKGFKVIVGRGEFPNAGLRYIPDPNIAHFYNAA